MATELYHRTITFDYGDQERNDLMKEVWASTPWMIDFHTGSPDDRRYRQIKEWLCENFGPEAWPIHGRSGRWQFGCAIVFGSSFIGFSTESEMNEFLAAWPSREAT